MKKFLALSVSLLLLLPSLSAQESWEILPRENEVDVCVYGATSSGIIAAVTARREGHSVMLI